MAHLRRHFRPPYHPVAYQPQPHLRCGTACVAVLHESGSYGESELPTTAGVSWETDVSFG